MTKLMGKVFRGILEFWIWFSLILWAALGGVGGYALGGFYRFTYVFPCIIGGLVLGFLITALWSGLVANFLVLCDNTQKLVDKKTSD
jgi:hypothetical protein